MMARENISSIGVDDLGSLWVKPSKSAFPHIYREAMEINWDNERCVLFCPKPLKWTHVEWFKQLLYSAHYNGINLLITSDTDWVNIDSKVANSFEEGAAEVWRYLGINP